MIEKINAMSSELFHLKEIPRLVTSIHKLHFSKEALDRDNNLTDKFVAEIILGMPTKRKKLR